MNRKWAGSKMELNKPEVEHGCSDSWLRFAPWQEFVGNVILTFEWSTIIFFVTKSISTLDRIWFPGVAFIWLAHISHFTLNNSITVCSMTVDSKKLRRIFPDGLPWWDGWTRRWDSCCRISSCRTISFWLDRYWSCIRPSFLGILRNGHWNQSKNQRHRI